MGVYDRDYYRQDSSGGGVLGGVAPVCKALIAINVAVFVLQVLTTRSPNFEATFWLDLQPERVVFRFELWRLITYAFCHSEGTPWHIVGNMFFLWICGSHVEPIYGPREFLRFYLTAALLAGIGFLAFTLAFGSGRASMYGASGAVMGVAMLCAMYYPTMKILVMFVIPVELRWLVAIGVVLDVYSTLTEIGGGSPIDNVAHTAHLAGLVYGYLYKKLDLRYSRLPADWSWPGLKRMVRTAIKRKPEHVKLYEPPQEKVPSADLNRQVDEILAKISSQGESSLSESEREILKEASRRYKKR